MQFQALELSENDRIAAIKFNRPEAANGLNLQMATELATASRSVAGNPDLKAVILTGEGSFFVSAAMLNLCMMRVKTRVRRSVK